MLKDGKKMDSKKILKSMISLVLLTQSSPLCLAQDEFDEFDSPSSAAAPSAHPTAAAPRFGGGSGAAGATSSLAKKPSAMDSSSDSDKDEKSSKDLLSKAKKEKLTGSSIDEITDKNFPEMIDSFDYNNADITDVIKAISELTGKNFIIDPGVRGKITVIAPTKITVAEAYKAFLSALAINGFTVVQSGNFLKVKNVRNAQRDNIETYSGQYFPNSDQMITRIIHLKYIQAEQVNRELRILPSKDGEMVVYTPTNSLILSDWGANIERVMKIINQLDVPGFEEIPVVIQIKNAKAKDMAELINKIVNKDSGGKSSGGSFSAGVPRFGGNTGGANSHGGSGTAYFMVIPDDRTNSLIVVGNNQGIARVRKLITQLDFRIRPEDAGGFYVYYVRNGDAKKIATTLGGITKENKPTGFGGGFGGAGAGSAPGGAASPGDQAIFGGSVKIVADEETNSLIVTAGKTDYEIVLSLLAKIDIPRDQVFVEAVIMEMSLNDDFKHEIGYFNYSGESKGMVKSGFNGFSDITKMIGPTAGSGAILPLSAGKETEITLGTQTVKVSSVLGFVNLLKSVAKTNVLSTPQIMALDNEDAEIVVGEDVAVSLNQTVGANGQTTTSANYKEAALKLKIKPFISPAGDTIRMKIEQKIGSPKQQAGLNDTITITKREITTNIVVPDGDTAVLGGLVMDNDSESVTKVPILGDIPVLGWLFKSKTTKKTKTNLIVLLTPKIIRNQADRSNLLGKKLDQRLNFIKGAGGKDPYGKTIDELPHRTASSNETPTIKNTLDPITSKAEEPKDPILENNNNAVPIESSSPVEPPPSEKNPLNKLDKEATESTIE
jgi:general secretion pathway protein D